MTKIFLDSNIWLRFFLHDNKQFEPAEQLINLIEEGRFFPYASSIVLMEIGFVLGKVYVLPKPKIVEYLSAIIDTRNITILDKTDHRKTMYYYDRYNVKFNDCLIASQIAKGMILVTFDKEFLKIKEISVRTPGQII